VVLVAGGAVAFSRLTPAPPVASTPSSSASASATPAPAPVAPAAAEQAVRNLLSRLSSDPAAAVAAAGPSLRGTGSAAKSFVDGVRSLDTGAGPPRATAAR